MGRKQHFARRGLVLLIVLGMLALFSLLVVTYVVFSTESKNASLVLARTDYRAQSPRTTTDQLLRLVLRGKQTPGITNEPPNSLYRHDLLGDLYGDPRRFNLWYGSDPLVGTVSSTVFDIKPTPASESLGYVLGIQLPNNIIAPNTATLMSGALSGRVLTFTSGTLRNRSFRISTHEYVSAASMHFVTILAQDKFGVPAANLVNSGILINDAIFDGSGALAVDRAPSLGVGGTVERFFGSKSIPIALLPHHKMLMLHQGDFQFWLVGDPDESFDVPDYNDMFLAHRSADFFIPSYHRPELLSYIASRYSLGTGAISLGDLMEMLAMLESATLRPLSFNVIDTNDNVIRQRNPYWRQGTLVENTATPSPRVPTLNLRVNLSGASDPNSVVISGQDVVEVQKFLNFHLSGPWDVDTDGDFVPDAVWIDPGLPIQTGPNGKLLKPMAAIQILSLDGRLDLNAVGDMLQAEADYGVMPILELATSSNRILSQGAGFGVAEIGIGHLFQSTVASRNFFRTRYAPGRSSANSFYFPGQESTTASDLSSLFREFEVRGVHAHGGLPGYSRDTRGRQAYAIDRAGNLVSLNSVSSLYSGSIPPENINDPYESRILTGGNADSFFTVAELERVMRRFDPDYEMLPSRLENALGGAATLSADSRVRDSVTTRSSSITTVAPGFYYLPFSPHGDTPFNDPLDHPVYSWLKRYIADQRVTGYELRQDTFEVLFPFEFRTGQKLDINRLLGNGTDDNGNLQIDEPIEWFVNATTANTQSIRGFDATLDYYLSGRSSFNPPLDRDVTQAGPVQVSGMETRQLLARELYCLFQAIVPYDYIFPDFPRPNPNNYPSPSDTAVRAFRARKLAQWAVNIIDFRDSDSACTRFVYDIEPFNSTVWDLSVPSETGIVWGMEQPELLLTENLSFHDRRVKDTRIGSDGRVEQDEERDDDMDQYRIPQGTSIFELYVPRTTGNQASPQLAGVSSSLYNVNGAGDVQLNLNAFAPSDGTRPSQPVWRLAISRNQQRGDANRPNPNEAFQDTAIRGGYGYQPNVAAEALRNGLAYNLGDPTDVPESAELERVVYFSTSVPAQIPLNGAWVPSSRHAYWNRTAVTSAIGGQYIVVAPRERTYVGSLKSALAVPVHQPSPQSIDMSIAARSIRLNGIAGNVRTDTASMPVKSIVPLIATGETPTARKQEWDRAFPNGIGVSISEPLPGDGYENVYSVPTKRLNSDDTPGPGDGFGELPPDSYYDYSDQTGAFPDEPFDINNDALPNRNVRTRTELNVRTVYLQRLADPSRPYDATFNPYIAVDWMPMDLTVFNGEDDVDEELTTMNGPISRDPNDPADPNRRIQFGSRVRSDGNIPRHYFTYVSLPPSNTSRIPNINPAPPNFPYELGQRASLGFLNVANLGQLPVSPVPGYEGMPSEEFCSLTWMNRVYGNPLELALVPMSAPGQFHQDFSPRESLNQAVRWYTASDVRNNLPFGHLPPFYSTSHLDGAGNLVPGANLTALLSFVEVGPPWAEYWKTLDPTLLEVAIANQIPNADAQRALLSFRGPYSQVPSHVVPGKVNLNTIVGPEVWHGLEWNTLDNGARNNPNAPLQFWNRFRTSLEGQAGYPTTTAGTDPFGTSGSPVDWSAPALNWAKPNINFEYPTRFAGAFKENFSQARLAPTEHLKRNPVDVTLFRADRSGGVTPLFLRDPTTSSFDQSKHASVHYQDTARLGNLTTAHSNVFGVWMTLSYFEWNEQDGLLQEHKVATGENKRYRSFFVIDRSIPVGYRPGEDWNVENTVLIRRYLD